MQESNASITILCPKGNAGDRHFPNGAGVPGDPGHAPINYHAYAACVSGAYLTSTKEAIERRAPVLLLITRHLQRCHRALSELKRAGLTVAVALKETGIFQFAKQFVSGGALHRFRQILLAADGVITTTQALEPVYRTLLGRGAANSRVEFIPTPYPVDDAAWDFSVPLPERQGIFVGTRQFRFHSRNHLFSFMLMGALAKRDGFRLGIIRQHKRVERKRFDGYLRALELEPHVNIHGFLPYAEYLRLMARYRVVFQLDQSLVPGQVAGDACLCGTICVGGNGAVDSLLFPGFYNPGQDFNELLTQMDRLLTDDDLYQGIVSESQKRARELLSFQVGRDRLRAFFQKIAA